MAKALLVVGMQQEVQTQINGGRDNYHPDALTRMPVIIEAFREAALEVIHVLHRDEAQHLSLHPHSEGYPPIYETQAMDDEHVFVKTTTSIFESTDIERYMKDKGIDEIYFIGSDHNSSILHSVSAAIDKEFKTDIVSDGMIRFDRHERGMSAESMFNMSLSCMESDGAHITNSETLLEDLRTHEQQQD